MNQKASKSLILQVIKKSDMISQEMIYQDNDKWCADLGMDIGLKILVSLAK